MLTQHVAKAKEDEKIEKRKANYEKKKARKKEEWTQHLRAQTGIDGFAALYKVLGLAERKLATRDEIKRAYHRRSLLWHPDKHRSKPAEEQEDAAQRFLEVKAAYDLLLEGMETGGAGLGGAVFSAGELTAGPGKAGAPTGAMSELQQRAAEFAQRVSTGAAWQG